MTRLIIHNHMPRRAVDVGRSVSPEEEERNRSAAYRATGISRDENQGLARELERLRDGIEKAQREGDKDKVRELRQLYNEAQGSLVAHDSSPEMQAFKQRQAERKARAEEGKTRADALDARVKAAFVLLKNRDRLKYNATANRAASDVKTMRAHFTLALNALAQGNVQSYNSWMEGARKSESDANGSATSVERQAAGPW